MSRITSASDAVAKLYAFKSDKASLTQELDRLLSSGEAKLSRADLEEVCQFWQIPVPRLESAGARKYGSAADFSATTRAQSGGAQVAQETARKFGAPPGMAVSDFAATRHKPGTGYSYFAGTKEELLSLVKEHWKNRVPGDGRTNLDEVVIVPVPAEKFFTTTVKIDKSAKLSAQFTQRRANEDPFLRIIADGQAEPAQFARVVLYAKETLAKNNERSSKADWEVVSIIASPVEDEPMDPTTMARNMLSKAGGSQVDYTAEQFAKSVWFWSQHAKVTG